MNGYGVTGLSGNTNMIVFPTNQAGVAGVSESGPGVVGFGTGGSGVWGIGSGRQFGVEAWNGLSAIGRSDGVAGAFTGDVIVLGTILAQSKQFQIDHPLDPINKYLNHTSVESSEMKTIYDGVVVLDESGRAEVELPGWFEALNTTIRYQLTPIGGAAPDLHVAEEVSGNRFKIAGRPARLKVCWQVTGVRHDSFALSRPLVVETDKSAEEQGYFLHPEHHGQPPQRGITRARNPELMLRIEQERLRGSQRST